MGTPNRQIQDFSEFDDELTDEALDRERSAGGYTTPAACHSRECRGGNHGDR